MRACCSATPKRLWMACRFRCSWRNWAAGAGGRRGGCWRRSRDAGDECLREVRAILSPGDALLLSTDLVKPVSQLLLAYNDPAGVTAAFNRNLLCRLNRELGANFDLSAFAHEARWNARERRIE